MIGIGVGVVGDLVNVFGMVFVCGYGCDMELEVDGFGV